MTKAQSLQINANPSAAVLFFLFCLSAASLSASARILLMSPDAAADVPLNRWLRSTAACAVLVLACLFVFAFFCSAAASLAEYKACDGRCRHPMITTIVTTLLFLASLAGTAFLYIKVCRANATYAFLEPMRAEDEAV